MKVNSGKIAGGSIALAGILELIGGICEKTFSHILMGICFFMIGCLHFFDKRK